MICVGVWANWPTALVRRLCRQSWTKHTIWTATGRTTSASCARSPNARRPGITYRVLGDDFSLTDGDSGYIECYIRMTRKWDDKKYVRPIPTTALNDNPALGQNYGWEK